jgi:alpha-N-acetylglucosaminidase
LQQTSGLHDYASKLWGGLVRDFYYPRWNLFTSLLSSSLTHGTTFDYDSFVTQVQTLEYSWSTANNTYPNVPSGNAVTLAAQMLAKYQNYVVLDA